MNKLNEEFIKIIQKIDEDSKLPGANIVSSILKRENDIDDLHYKIVKTFEYLQRRENRSIIRKEISRIHKTEIERVQLAYNIIKSFIDNPPNDLAPIFVPILKSYIKGTLIILNHIKSEMNNE